MVVKTKNLKELREEFEKLQKEKFEIYESELAINEMLFEKEKITKAEYDFVKKDIANKKDIDTRKAYGLGYNSLS